jgi:hypothetical protein
MKHQAPITAVAAPARGRVRPFRSADGGRRGRSRAEARPTGVLEGSGVVGRVWVPAFAGMTGGRLVRLKAHPTGVGVNPYLRRGALLHTLRGVEGVLLTPSVRPV